MSVSYTLLGLLVDLIEDALSAIDNDLADDIIDSRIRKSASMVSSLEELKTTHRKHGVVFEPEFPDGKWTTDLNQLLLGRIRTSLHLYSEEVGEPDEKTKSERKDGMINMVLSHFPSVQSAPAIKSLPIVNFVSIEISYEGGGVEEGEYAPNGEDGSTKKFQVNDWLEIHRVLSTACASKPPVLAILRYKSLVGPDHSYSDGVQRGQKGLVDDEEEVSQPHHPLPHRRQDTGRGGFDRQQGRRRHH